MSENDPWKRLVALVAHLTPNTEDGARRSMAVLDAMEAQFAARAAERDELWGSNHLNANALRLCQVERDNQYTQAVEATQRALLAEQALANVEAERDKQAEQIADLTMHKASRDSQLGCLLEDIGGKKYPTMNEARDQIAAWKAMTAERDRLKAALKDIRRLTQNVSPRRALVVVVETRQIARAALASGKGTAK